MQVKQLNGLWRQRLFRPVRSVRRRWGPWHRATLAECVERIQDVCAGARLLPPVFSCMRRSRTTCLAMPNRGRRERLTALISHKAPPLG